MNDEDPRIIRTLLDIPEWHRQAREVVFSEGVCRTINSQSNNTRTKIVHEGRVRYLTPREVWRLMGFTDRDHDRAASTCSPTRLYSQAGNSICVPVLEALFESMLL